jgi:invasion protein IalB
MMLRFASLGLAFAIAGAAAAAEKTKSSPNPSAEAPKKEADPVGSDPQLTTATYGDWVERCQRVNVGRICEVAQSVVAQGQTTPLAEIAVGRARKGAPLRLTLVLPVNVSFPSAPKIAAAGADAVELAWKQCVPAGCFADAAFGGDALDAWRSAKSAKVETKVATGQILNFEISLRGLPQALDALNREP